MTLIAALIAALPACQDYGLTKANEVGFVDTAAPASDTGEWIPEDTEAPPTEDTGIFVGPEDTDLPEDTEPPEDTGVVEPEPDCEAAALSPLTWWGSATFSEEADPVDGAGLAFWEPGFSAEGWTELALPDVAQIPAGQDRAYRAIFTLDALPPALEITLQSDDGIWLYLNSEPVGHWGGEWQQEGCVNDESSCLVFVSVDPLDVTPWLVEGENVLAARVSNPVENAWFDLTAACVDPEEK
jgi:hypothetical protein